MFVAKAWTMPATPTLDNVETTSTTTAERCENAGVDNPTMELVRHIRTPLRVLVHCRACGEVWTTHV